MIKEIKGDLLDLFDQGEFDIIAHGCNSHSIMGAGIAAQIKERYPAAYNADRFSDLGPISKLGNFTFAFIPKDKVIFNLYTQYNPGPNAEPFLIATCFNKMKLLLERFEGLKTAKIGIPMIGCGIGGLNWDDIKPIIEKQMEGYDLTVVKYEKTGNTETV